MRRKQLTPLIFIVLVMAVSLGAVLATKTSPLLGLDLQGGVSVRLEPVGPASDDALRQTVSIIRNRVDALGVAEPNITRQGRAVIVELPGIQNQQRALELVGDTAELRFRPVLSVIPGAIDDLLSSTTTTAAGETTTTVAEEAPATEEETSSTVAGQSAGAPATPFQEDPAAPDPAAEEDPAAVDPTAEVDPIDVDPAAAYRLTPREEDIAENPVVLAEYDRKDSEKVLYTYQLGPSGATGQIVSDASAELGQNGQWQVRLVIKGGDGINAFNTLAAQCNAGASTCPTRQLAIVLDSKVVSAPTIQQAAFERDRIQISGAFSQSEAKDLALVLRYGSLPVILEQQNVETVSATLGEESLRAGLVAGFVGLALVVLYMLVYYRALGLVVLFGLGVWSGLNYALISWLGETQGLALGLAGVTGLVVSVGVTVDSYVVYFERLKDEVAAGRPLQSSTDRAFHRSWRTILAANFTSFIGAGLLYWLTVGQVRGFAFTLGLATVLDIVVAWFFIRPMVGILARRRFFAENRVFGILRGLNGKAGTIEDPVAAAESRRRSLLARLYHGETQGVFVARFRTWVVLSTAIIAVGLGSFAVRGLNLGLEFRGGSIWEVPANGVTVPEAQEALEGAGLDDATVQTLESDGQVRLRVQSESVEPARAAEITTLLAEKTGSNTDEVVIESVGPSWGAEISEKALRALGVFLLAITLYISLRFELRMAIPTVAALLHDVAITVGVYSLFGFEVTSATVIAVLTILGFSIYDGIVVFDKVEENTPLVGVREDLTYGEMVDKSLNEVLMRSLNTSITALLPVASLLLLGSLVLGATTLQEFALALLVGLFAGAYSSIFIASPLHAVMKEREPRFREIKERLVAKRSGLEVRAPLGSAAVTVDESGRRRRPAKAAGAVAVLERDDEAGDDDGTGDEGASPVASSTARPTPTNPLPGATGERIIPPRPRKKGKKR